MVHSSSNDDDDSASASIAFTTREKRQRTIQLVPVYGRKRKGKVVELELPAGRVELSKAWWKGCPNSCYAHLPGLSPTCTEFCRPLRRSVGALSRELLVVVFDDDENSEVGARKIEVSPNCRHKEVIHLTQIYRLSQHQPEVYDLWIGTEVERPWMRFRVQWAHQITPEEDGDDDAAFSPLAPTARRQETTPGCWLQATTTAEPIRHRKALPWEDSADQDSSLEHDKDDDGNIGRLSESAGSAIDERKQCTNNKASPDRKRKLFSAGDWSWSKEDDNETNIGPTEGYDYMRLHRELPLAQPSGTDDDSPEDHRPLENEFETTQRALFRATGDEDVLSVQKHSKRRASKSSSPSDTPPNESFVGTKPKRVTPQTTTTNNCQKLTIPATSEQVSTSAGYDCAEAYDRFKRRRLSRPSLKRPPAMDVSETRLGDLKMPAKEAAASLEDDNEISGEKLMQNGTEQQHQPQSYLSLPIHQTGSSSQDSSFEAGKSTQMVGGRIEQMRDSKHVAPPPVQRACELTLAEWTAMQRDHSHDAATKSFRQTVVDLVLAKNQQGDRPTQPMWLPPLIDDETLLYHNG